MKESIGDMFNPFGQNTNSFNSNIFLFLFLNLLCLSLVFLSFFLLTLFLNLNILGVKYASNVVSNISDLSMTILLLGTFVHAPIEELLCRWGLKFTPFSFTILIFGYFTSILGFFQVSKQIVKWDKLFLLSIIGITVFLIFLFWLYVRYNQKLISKKFKTFEKYIFYFSIFLFGFSHFTKFDLINCFNAIIFSPIIFLPYLIMGYFFGLIRMKFGILGSIFLHGCTNFLIPFLDYFSN